MSIGTAGIIRPGLEHQQQLGPTMGGRSENATGQTGPFTHFRKVAAVAQKTKKTSKGPAPSSDRDIPHQVAMATLATQFANGKKLLSYDGKFYHFDQGYWQPIDENAVASRTLAAMTTMRPEPRGNTASIATQAVKLLLMNQARSADPFAAANLTSPVINCRNGEVWLNKRGRIDFRPHTPANHLNHRLNVDYDPTAKCPIYDRTVREIFAGASNPKAMRRHWHELAGYMLQPPRPFAIVLVLDGTGRNGKSLLIKIVIELMGKSVVYAAPVASLTGRWSTAHLAGKRLFVDDDVAKDCVLPDGILKTISEEKILTGERKYRDKAEVLCGVVPVLLCNNLPVLQDISTGMQRRLQVIPFERTFTGNAEDALLLDKIRDQELSGVLNRMLKGLQRLTRRGHFRIPIPVKQATEKWVASANVVERFLQVKCKEDAAKSAWGDQLYKAFRQFVTDEGLRSCPTKRSFYDDLEHKGFHQRHGNRGKRFSGIILR
jgi:P4 family phage/plasmid primase-like protien